MPDPISAALLDSLAAFDDANEFPNPLLDVETGERIEEDPNAPFVVDNDRKATWAMRKLLDHRTRVDEIRAIADAEHERIEQWAQVEADKHTRDIAYFESLLVQYAHRERQATDGKRKSISTPYGTVKSRAGQPKWEIDTETLLPWLHEAHPDWIRVTEAPDLMSMKAALEVADTDSMGTVVLDEGGVIVPGVAVSPATVNYTIEVAK